MAQLLLYHLDPRARQHSYWRFVCSIATTAHAERVQNLLHVIDSNPVYKGRTSFRRSQHPTRLIVWRPFRVTRTVLSPPATVKRLPPVRITVTTWLWLNRGVLSYRCEKKYPLTVTIITLLRSIKLAMISALACPLFTWSCILGTNTSLSCSHFCTLR